MLPFLLVPAACGPTTALIIGQKPEPSAERQIGFLKTTHGDVNPPLFQGDAMGTSVSVSGSTLVIGVPGEDGPFPPDPDRNDLGDSGAAYVFEWTGTGWQQTAYLKAPNAQAQDLFGASVAIHGDTLVVGAPFEDGGSSVITTPRNAANDRADSGAAYVFQRAGGNWTFRHYLKAFDVSGIGSVDRFGTSVAISHDIIVVGAPRCDSLGPGRGRTPASDADMGSAYVFDVSGDLAEVAQLVESDTGFPGGDFDNNRFGSAVAISEDTIVVGSPGANFENIADCGAATVFRLGSTVERLLAIRDESPIPLARLGHALAIASIPGGGHVVAIGAPGTEDPRAPGAHHGHVLVLEGAGSTWSRCATGHMGDNFVRAHG